MADYRVPNAEQASLMKLLAFETVERLEEYLVEVAMMRPEEFMPKWTTEAEAADWLAWRDDLLIEIDEHMKRKGQPKNDSH